MTETTAAELIEEWQTGAFLLASSAFVGFVVGGALGRGFSSSLSLPGFVGGATFTFLVLSYLLYGR